METILKHVGDPSWDAAIKKMYSESKDKVKTALDLGRQGIRFALDGSILHTQKGTAVNKSERKSKVSFSNVILKSRTKDDDDESAKAKAITAAQRAFDDAKDDDDDDEEAKQKALKVYRAALKAALDDKKDDDEDDTDDDVKSKAAYDLDDDKKDDDDTKTKGRVQRFGRAAKVSKAGVFASWLDGSMHAVKEFDLTDTSRDGKLEGADDGEDALGREYADQALERLGGGLTGSHGDTSGIPNAGGTDPWLGDTRSTPNSGFKPMAGGEGDAGHIVEDKGRLPVKPNKGNGEAYELLREGMEPGTSPVRVGPFVVMNPGISGLTEPASAQFPDAKTSVLKRAKRGIFASVLDDKKNPVTGFGQ